MQRLGVLADRRGRLKSCQFFESRVVVTLQAKGGCRDAAALARPWLWLSNPSNSLLKIVNRAHFQNLADEWIALIAEDWTDCDISSNP